MATLDEMAGICGCGSVKPEPGEYQTRDYGLVVDRMDGVTLASFPSPRAVTGYLRSLGVSRVGAGSWCDGVTHVWQADRSDYITRGE